MLPPKGALPGWNSGPGDLEMKASPFVLPGAVQVFQVVENEDGTEFSNTAGLFDFHETHKHWHWVGFSVYRVWSLTPDGNLSEIVSSSDKVGYCLLDLDPYTGADAPLFPGLQPAVRPQFGGCDWTRQGISAGWIDSYKSHVDGQYVIVTDLPDGVYALESVVDPDDIIAEADEDNNGALVYFLLEGEEVMEIGDTFVPFVRTQGPR